MQMILYYWSITGVSLIPPHTGLKTDFLLQYPNTALACFPAHLGGNSQPLISSSVDTLLYMNTRVLVTLSPPIKTTIQLLVIEGRQSQCLHLYPNTAFLHSHLISAWDLISSPTFSSHICSSLPHINLYYI